jgi:uncharacterized protein (DUF433 family)
MEAAIIDRGRGPEIAGTRITVYTILDYLELGWHRDRIAIHFRLSSDQVQAAIDYVEANKEVMTDYQSILERCANARNPPEIEAKAKESRKKLLAFRRQLKKAKERGESLPVISAKNGWDTSGMIIPRGNGPVVAGTRITVYTILDYLELGWHRDRIAVELRLSSIQVQAAIDYIAANQDKVMSAYQRILDRSAKAANPPPIEALRQEGHQMLLAFRRQSRQKKRLEAANARPVARSRRRRTLRDSV